jgi:hypothetical protein
MTPEAGSWSGPGRSGPGAERCCGEARRLGARLRTCARARRGAEGLQTLSERESFDRWPGPGQARRVGGEGQRSRGGGVDWGSGRPLGSGWERWQHRDSGGAGCGAPEGFSAVATRVLARWRAAGECGSGRRARGAGQSTRRTPADQRRVPLLATCPRLARRVWPACEGAHASDAAGPARLPRRHTQLRVVHPPRAGPQRPCRLARPAAPSHTRRRSRHLESPKSLNQWYIPRCMVICFLRLEHTWYIPVILNIKVYTCYIPVSSIQPNL